MIRIFILNGYLAGTQPFLETDIFRTKFAQLVGLLYRRIITTFCDKVAVLGRATSTTCGARFCTIALCIVLAEFTTCEDSGVA